MSRTQTKWAARKQNEQQHNYLWACTWPYEYVSSYYWKCQFKVFQYIHDIMRVIPTIYTFHIFLEYPLGYLILKELNVEFVWIRPLYLW